MLTIAPPRSRISTAAARVHRNIVSRLSRNIACHSSSEISTSGWSGKFWPALLTRMSIGPELLARGVKEAVCAGLVDELATDRDGGAARPLDPGDQLVGRLAPSTVVDDDARPGGREPLRDARTEAL